MCALRSKLNELRIAVLNQMRVSRSGENLYVMCPNIRELNLSGNLFHSWHPVADIARQLTHLHVLNIRYGFSKSYFSTSN